MPPHETSPLLGSHDNGGSTRKPFDPLGSTRHLLLGSWINILLVCIPLAFVADALHWSAAARFSTSFLAIVPLAKLLGDSTEQLSLKLGQTLGGLLNATFGNAVELIVAIAALVQNHASETEQTAAATLKSLLEDGAPDPADSSLRGLLVLSRGTSIILLLTYLGYLYFQLRTHAQLFEAEQVEGEEEEVAAMDQWSAGAWLVIITVLTSFCADILVGSIDETAQQFIGLILLPLVGNAAEHVTSVWMACKGKMELTIGANFETIVLFVSVMLVNLLLQDGRTNYMEGVMLMSLYLVIALSYLV
ncbi:calcium/proton exchanger [Kwoniella newhampshirensis]|uniref:Calcium/proton exchanger n=1 Tax=Kwoniella newhampshirensis TaxID=1651941 RepID=A0AAW0Z737_9TREE